VSGAVSEDDEEGVEEEGDEDTRIYCFCQQTSHGEVNPSLSTLLAESAHARALFPDDRMRQRALQVCVGEASPLQVALPR
jgi:hypothetical protein